MDTKTLVSIGIFVFVLVLTVRIWAEYLGSKRVREGFQSGSEQSGGEDILSDAMLKTISNKNEVIPTDQEATEAHEKLLRYIQHDFRKGVKFVMDFGDRFYGENLPLREDLDVRRLLDNYQSPLQRL